MRRLFAQKRIAYLDELEEEFGDREFSINAKKFRQGDNLSKMKSEISQLYGQKVKINVFNRVDENALLVDPYNCDGVSIKVNGKPMPAEKVFKAIDQRDKRVGIIFIPTGATETGARWAAIDPISKTAVLTIDVDSRQIKLDRK